MTPEQETQFAQDIGKLKANVDTYHADTKKALDLITGNGKPEDGILYIMTDIRKGIRDLKDWTIEHTCETHEQLENRVKALENAAADKKTEIQAADAVAQAVEGAVVIKYKWLKDSIAKIIPILKHPAMLVAYVLFGGGGTIALNSHNIAGSIKALLKFIVSAAVEAYKNGGQ
jgi:hypothetical protein